MGDDVDPFLKKVCQQLRDDNNGLAGRAKNNCAFLARAVIEALHTRHEPGAPASAQKVEERHWLAWAETGMSAKYMSYEIDMESSIPMSLAPMMKDVLVWEADGAGTLCERETPPRFLRLQSVDLSGLLERLRGGARTCERFGIVVMAGAVTGGAHDTPAGHVIVFRVSRTGSVRFVDPSQKLQEDQLFEDLESRRRVYECGGLQVDPVFCLFCDSANRAQRG